MRKVVSWLMILPNLIGLGDGVRKLRSLLIADAPWADSFEMPDDSRGYGVPDDELKNGRRLTADAGPAKWHFSIPEASATVSRGDQFLLNPLGPPLL